MLNIKSNTCISCVETDLHDMDIGLNNRKIGGADFKLVWCLYSSRPNIGSIGPYTDRNMDNIRWIGMLKFALEFTTVYIHKLFNIFG